MKKLFIGLMLALAITACKKDEVIEKPKVFLLDPNAMVRIEGIVSKMSKVRSADSPATDTIPRELALDIVKRGKYYVALDTKGYNVIGIWPGKDTISASPALLRWGVEIIADLDGYGHYGLVTGSLELRNQVICTGDNQTVDAYTVKDTIAYIPNSQMIAAKDAIIKTLADKDTAAVYSIFQNAFKFKPCTGAEYRKLKAEGKN